MCHSIVAHLLDISTGERYIYGCVMLYALIVACGLPVLVVWYDINCKFAAYFLRWAAQHPMLWAALSGLPFPMRFPLPIFHRYCHRCAQMCMGCNDCWCVEVFLLIV